MNKHQEHLLRLMLNACAYHASMNKNLIHFENEFKSLILMLYWLDSMQKTAEMNTEQARIHVDIQKTTMRTRLMALPDLNVVETEHLINEAIDSIRKEVYKDLSWIII